MSDQNNNEVKKRHRRSPSPYRLRFMRRGEYAHYVDVRRQATSALCDMSVYDFDEWLGDQNNYQRSALQDKILCRLCAHRKKRDDAIREGQEE